MANVHSALGVIRAVSATESGAVDSAVPPAVWVMLLLRDAMPSSGRSTPGPQPAAEVIINLPLNPQRVHGRCGVLTHWHTLLLNQHRGACGAFKVSRGSPALSLRERAAIKAQRK